MANLTKAGRTGVMASVFAIKEWFVQLETLIDRFLGPERAQVLSYYVVATLAITTFTVWSVSWLFWFGPLCCADNVYIAIPASNLMEGRGYTSSFPMNVYMWSGISPEASVGLAFDPGVSTGGPSQALSALLQAGFPDSLYAPDISGIVTRALLLFGIAAWWPSKNLLGSAAFAGFLLVLTIIAHQSLAVMVTGIGDYTAPLFFIWSALGFMLAVKHDDLRYGIAGCVLIYLGVITKLNAIVFALPFCIAIMGYLAFQRKWIWLGAFSGTGLAIIAIQELVILFSLGFEGYGLNKIALMVFIDRTSNQADFDGGWSNLREHFFISIQYLIFTFLSLMIVTFTVRMNKASFILAAFCVTSGLFLLYGVAFAGTNPRYFIMPSVIAFGGFFLAATTLASDLKSFSLSPRTHWGVLTAMTMLISGLLFSGDRELWMFEQQGWLPAQNRQKEENLRSFQTYLEGLGAAEIYSFSWQNAVVPELLTSEPVRVSFSSGRVARDGYFVVDTRWTQDAHIPSFVATNCTLDFDLAPFRVYACQG